MSSTLRMLAALTALGATAIAAHAGGTAVNTMGRPHYDASYETFDPFGVTLSSAAINHAASTQGSIGVSTAIGSLWNSEPAVQQAVVTNDGATFWSAASGPLISTPGFSGAVGGESRVSVAQSFTKTSAAAELRFTYSGGLLQSFRDAERRPDCANGLCTFAEVRWEISLWRNDMPGAPTLMWETGSAKLVAENGVLRFSRSQAALDGSPVNPLWSWDCARCDQPALGLANARLQAPFTGNVDLSAVPFDPLLTEQPEFTVLFSLRAVASSETEWVGATAWARDPLDLESDAGIGLTVLDLQPTNNPIAVVPEPATTLLLAAGLGVVFARRRLRRHSSTTNSGATCPAPASTA